MPVLADSISFHKKIDICSQDREPSALTQEAGACETAFMPFVRRNSSL
jgi:hypothetical protein